MAFTTMMMNNQNKNNSTTAGPFFQNKTQNQFHTEKILKDGLPQTIETIESIIVNTTLENIHAAESLCHILRDTLSSIQQQQQQEPPLFHPNNQFSLPNNQFSPLNNQFSHPNNQFTGSSESAVNYVPQDAMDIDTEQRQRNARIRRDKDNDIIMEGSPEAEAVDRQSARNKRPSKSARGPNNNNNPRFSPGGNGGRRHHRRGGPHFEASPSPSNIAQSGNSPIRGNNNHNNYHNGGFGWAQNAPNGRIIKNGNNKSNNMQPLDRALTEIISQRGRAWNPRNNNSNCRGPRKSTGPHRPRNMPQAC